MEETLAQSPAVLVTLEFWPAGLQGAGCEPTAFLAYCRQLGFAIRVQRPDEKRLIDLSDSEILESCNAGNGEGHLNLVLERDRSR